MRKRQAVRQVQGRLGVSQRQACRALSQPRSTQRYAAQQRTGEEELRRRMRELALRHPRYGYRRIAILLEAAGWKVNRKRARRLWQTEGLKVPQTRQKKRRWLSGSSANACYRKQAEYPNHVWSLDFCHDRTADGRPLKILSVLDEYTRVCLAIEVQRRITGGEVIQVLAAVMALHGAPRQVRCDNGPEFIGSAIRRWLAGRQVGPLYIQPGSPWENAYAESYHSRLRDELLDREEFGSLLEGQGMLEGWRVEYNEQRPHGALGYRTPQAFAAAWDRAHAAEPCSAPLRRAQPRGEEDGWLAEGGAQ
jgi:transposase InsO family protein